MNKVLKNSWALFLGMGFIMMAYGFQGSLLGVRAVQEEFSLTATGFMMSGYFIGYFIGAATIPNIISRVGHIRVFAAFASLASLIILVHSILIHPFIWFLLRILTGISMVCIYTVAESWLNDRSSNKNRGSVLSIYMVILYGTMGVGMFLLNFSRPENFQPFILVSVITSAALIPILLTKKKPPTFKKIKAMSLSELYEASPFGMVSSLFYGTIQSALFTLLAVFQKAIERGLKIDLLFVGPIDKSDEKTFKEWITNPTIKEFVNHIPWIDLSELPSYLNSIDICVCPLIKNAQHESGIANKIFQYLFGAKAIIASDCLPQQQLIESFNCGLVYANEDEFLACIEQLVNDESLRKEMGENGKEMLYQNYDNQKQENTLTQIFK